MIAVYSTIRSFSNCISQLSLLSQNAYKRHFMAVPADFIFIYYFCDTRKNIINAIL